MKNLFCSVSLIVATMFLSPSEANARCAWFGWCSNTEPHIGADGCTYYETTSDFYFFGINFGGSQPGDGWSEGQDCP